MSYKTKNNRTKRNKKITKRTRKIKKRIKKTKKSKRTTKKYKRNKNAGNSTASHYLTQLNNTNNKTSDYKYNTGTGMKTKYYFDKGRQFIDSSGFRQILHAVNFYLFDKTEIQQDSNSGNKRGMCENNVCTEIKDRIKLVLKQLQYFRYVLIECYNYNKSFNIKNIFEDKNLTGIGGSGYSIQSLCNEIIGEINTTEEYRIYINQTSSSDDDGEMRIINGESVMIGNKYYLTAILQFLKFLRDNYKDSDFITRLKNNDGNDGNSKLTILNIIE